MGIKMVVYCAIAAILGTIAAAIGFAGEATRVQASDVYMLVDTCVYPSSPAPALGIISAVLTMITRIFISAFFGEAGCCRVGRNATPMSKFLFVFSWVATIMAMVLLLAAAGLNVRQGGEIDTYGYVTCYVVKPGIFAGGAILALLSSIFGIAAYMCSPTQTTMNPSIALSMGDLEKNPVSSFPPQQYPSQKY